MQKLQKTRQNRTNMKKRLNRKCLVVMYIVLVKVLKLVLLHEELLTAKYASYRGHLPQPGAVGCMALAAFSNMELINKGLTPAEQKLKVSLLT
jgi:hypothetical protein